jgi:tetratricopeptide (TPR) repeat protein
MYLRTSKYRLKRKRPPRINVPLIVVACLAIIGIVYFQQFIVPTIPKPFLPTPTETRSAASFADEAAKLFSEGKLQASIDMYQQAIRANPKNTDLYIALSRVQVFEKDYAAALENSQNAVLRAKSAMAYAVYGEALRRLERYTDSEQALRHSLELDPNLALAHAYLSELIMDSDPDAGWKNASAEARTALSLAPNLMEGHRAMAYVYYLTANYLEASEEYEAAISINARLEDLFIPYGDCLLNQDLTQDAIKAYLQASALNAQDADPFARISRAYAKEGQYGKASQYAEDAVIRAPLDPRYHGLSGVMYYFNRNFTRSIAELSLVVNGGQTEDGTVPAMPLAAGRVAEYYWTYGLSLAKVGRCDEGIPVLRLVQQALPDDPVAQENVNQGLLLCNEITPTPVSEG